MLFPFVRCVHLLHIRSPHYHIFVTVPEKDRNTSVAVEGVRVVYAEDVKVKNLPDLSLNEEHPHKHYEPWDILFVSHVLDNLLQSWEWGVQDHRNDGNLRILAV